MESKKRKGFSLIELIIVFAVLFVIMAVIASSYGSSRAKARDALRKSTLKQLQVALELYRDKNGSYPVTFTNAWWAYSSETGDRVPNGLNNDGDWIPGLTPYFGELPHDPSGGTQYYENCSSFGWVSAYLYISNGMHYKIVAHCSSETRNFSTNDPFYDPARPNWAWMVCSGNQTACNTW